MPEAVPAGSEVRSPATEREWSDYYALRWRMLRAPWGQPQGSERDAQDNSAVHRMVCTPEGRVLAVGRLHRVDAETAQIRYMATDTDYQNNGLGTLILKSLEQAARRQGSKTIVLQARENALAFYERHGYRSLGASHRLYGAIQHYRMTRQL